MAPRGPTAAAAQLPRSRRGWEASLRAANVDFCITVRRAGCAVHTYTSGHNCKPLRGRPSASAASSGRTCLSVPAPAACVPPAPPAPPAAWRAHGGVRVRGHAAGAGSVPAVEGVRPREPRAQHARALRPPRARSRRTLLLGPSSLGVPTVEATLLLACESSISAGQTGSPRSRARPLVASSSRLPMRYLNG